MIKRSNVENNDIVRVLDHVTNTLQNAGNTFRQRTFCPEANKYSRAFTNQFPEIISKLTASELLLLIELVYKMDSNNICTTKQFSEIDLPKITRRRAIKTLRDQGLIFIYPNKKVFINPSLVVLTKYKLNCLTLKAEWNNMINEKDSIHEEK